MKQPNAVRRRRRTALITTSAAVLGVLAGGLLGYDIQDHRAPTPLPPLTGAMPVQPAGAGPVPKALPLAQDRDAVYRGDLLKLLVPTPKGDKEENRSWMSLADYAEDFENPAGAFTGLVDHQYQRGADAEWTDRKSSYFTVHLVQYRDDAAPWTPQEMLYQANLASGDSHYGASLDVPGTVDGQVWGSAHPQSDPGYEPIYSGHGQARVGNIYVEVWVDASKPVKASAVLALMKKQLVRL
ncbi:hypothetical protein [Actinacidiphila acididurans]|uniref:Uncharacterized protein n=1 Tax=Actinacidiphila acididurans TaxID=2784346 RepID=A0ABS2TYP6_9ACTN|nr:hypothetical protein [Actinacidiphila acididurans]MBM9508457.1 hypothetical protein [Actinacidiphila acididurans]